VTNYNVEIEVCDLDLSTVAVVRSPDPSGPTVNCQLNLGSQLR